MRTLKHIGKLKNTGSKVLVAFRTIPGESNQALVIQASQLPDSQHDSIMKLVESDQAQDAFEFGEILFTRPFPDGRSMLRALQSEGRLQKVPTDIVVMTPTTSSEIQLDQLNVLIAEQKNCAIDELCNFVSGGTLSDTKESTPTVEDANATKVEATVPETLDDKDLAKNLRSQADAMYKEAARLRREADELDPPAKKATKAKESVDA
jgi:hypothetical protein